MPVFRHLENEETYLPGLWDFASEPEARSLWSARLRTHLEDTLAYAREEEPRATFSHLGRIAPGWLRILDELGNLEAPPPARTVLELVGMRDALFRGERAGGAGATGDEPEPCGPVDVFASIKRRSNEWALARYGDVVVGARRGAR